MAYPTICRSSSIPTSAKWILSIHCSKNYIPATYDLEADFDGERTPLQVTSRSRQLPRTAFLDAAGLVASHNAEQRIWLRQSCHRLRLQSGTSSFVSFPGMLSAHCIEALHEIFTFMSKRAFLRVCMLSDALLVVDATLGHLFLR